MHVLSQKVLISHPTTFFETSINTVDINTYKDYQYAKFLDLFHRENNQAI